MDKAGAIFQFTDVIDFLNFEFESKRLRNQRFSLRAWSRQLGYQNPSFLSHILKRQRKLNLELAQKISVNLHLSDESKKYFEVLVLLQNSKNVDEKNLYIELIEAISCGKKEKVQSFNLEVFRVISDWYHAAILELIELKSLKHNAESIAQRLGGEVSVDQVEKATERLCRLGLVVRQPSGQLKRAEDNPILFESYIPSEAIRHFHKQMIEKAKAAIDQQDITERELRAVTVAIRKKDYEKAQRIIKEAHTKVLALARKGDADELYQLNTQWFRLTTKDGDL